MKFIFFILLSLNVVFFLWEYYGHQHSRLTNDETLLLAPDTKIDRIILAGEIQEGKNSLQLTTSRKESVGINPLGMNGYPSNKSLDGSLAANQPIRDFMTQEIENAGLNGFFGWDPVNRNDSEPFVPADGRPRSSIASETLCYRLGPKLSGDSFAQIARRFKNDGIPHSVKAESVEVETGFMVYYPAAESFEASKANVRILSSKGLRDLWLIDKGPMRGSISLGILKTRERAEVLQKELETTKQIHSRVQAKLSQRTGYFLVFEWLTADRDLPRKLFQSGFDTRDLLAFDPGNCRR